jgi:hypothetical protein
MGDWAATLSSGWMHATPWVTAPTEELAHRWRKRVVIVPSIFPIPANDWKILPQEEENNPNIEVQYGHA